jgi:hypothetical protein
VSTQASFCSVCGSHARSDVRVGVAAGRRRRFVNRQSHDPLQIDILHRSLTCSRPAHLLFISALMNGIDFALISPLLVLVSAAFETPLLVEIKAAWAFTVDRHLGLFSLQKQQQQAGAAHQTTVT